MNLKRIVSLMLSLAIMMTGCVAVMAKSYSRIAKITDLSGTVKVLKSGSDKSTSAFKGMSLVEGDTIKTGKNSSATLLLDNDKELKIDSNTTLAISNLKGSAGSTSTGINLLFGQIWTNIKNKLGVREKFEIKTPTAVMGVRGTMFGVRHVESGTQCNVLEGTVSASYYTVASAQQQPRIVTQLIPAGFGLLMNNASGSTPPPPTPLTPQQLTTFELQAIQQEPSRISPDILQGAVQELERRHEQGQDEEAGQDLEAVLPLLPVISYAPEVISGLNDGITSGNQGGNPGGNPGGDSGSPGPTTLPTNLYISQAIIEGQKLTGTLMWAPAANEDLLTGYVIYLLDESGEKKQKIADVSNSTHIYDFGSGMSIQGAVEIAIFTKNGIGESTGYSSYPFSLIHSSGSPCWALVGQSNISAGSASNLSLSVGADQKPYVSYKDSSMGTVVKKFDGSQWIQYGNVVAKNVSANNIQLENPSGGNLTYLTYSYKDAEGAQYFNTMEYNESQSQFDWQLLPSTKDENVKVVTCTDQSTAYALYYTPNQSNTQCYKWDETLHKWTSLGITCGAIKEKPDLKVIDGVLHVAFKDNTDNLKVIKYNSSTGWEQVGNTVLSTTTGNNDVALCSLDALYISYVEAGTVKVRKLSTSNTWDEISFELTLDQQSSSNYTINMERSDSGIYLSYFNSLDKVVIYEIVENTASKLNASLPSGIQSFETIYGNNRLYLAYINSSGKLNIVSYVACDNSSFVFNLGDTAIYKGRQFQLTIRNLTDQYGVAVSDTYRNILVKDGNGNILYNNVEYISSNGNTINLLPTAGPMTLDVYVEGVPSPETIEEISIEDAVNISGTITQNTTVKDIVTGGKTLTITLPQGCYWTDDILTAIKLSSLFAYIYIGEDGNTSMIHSAFMNKVNDAEVKNDIASVASLNGNKNSLTLILPPVTDYERYFDQKITVNVLAELVSGSLGSAPGAYTYIYADKAPAITGYTISQGTTNGINVTGLPTVCDDNTPITFGYEVVSAPIQSIPAKNVPTDVYLSAFDWNSAAASGTINNLNVQAGQYVRLYATVYDSNISARRIIMFKEIQITKDQIHPVAPQLTPDSYSRPEPGSTPGRTRITTLNYGQGITWYYNIYQQTPDTPPMLDSTIPTTSSAYIPGDDIPVNVGDILRIYAVDGNGNIKTYKDFLLDGYEINTMP